MLAVGWGYSSTVGFLKRVGEYTHPTNLHAPEVATMNLPRLIAMLPVASMPAAVSFYEQLGFAVEQRNDQWRWAKLRFGDSELMLDESINVHPEAPRQSVLYLYPENIAEYHRQLRDRGLAVPELDVTFYGMTEFRLEDPDGNRLWIGQQNPAR
jgi:uncharacterized glyoxalase superfamily protein PhnB